MNRRTVMVIVVLLILPASVAALVVTAPTPEEPRPTAFGDTAGDFSEWREQASDEGFLVRTAVSDPEMVQYIPEPDSTMVVIPQPRTPPSQSLQDAWEAHLGRGGTLLILDGSGATNRFLTGYGAAVTNLTVLDPTSGDPLTVRTQEPGRTGPPILGQAPSSLLLEEDVSWNVLLRTGADTFLDIDNNARVDRQDIPGPHVVAAGRETETGGRLMVVSSTTFFADHYVDDITTGNHARLLDLITTNLPPGATILIDESYHGWGFPENQLVGAAQAFSLPAAAVPWAAGAVIITSAAALVVALKMSTVDRYKQHQLAKTAIEPHHLDHTDGFFASMAAEIRSRSGSDTGPTSNGDPRSRGDWLEQAANGNLRPEDRVRLIQLYDSEVNQHA